MGWVVGKFAFIQALAEPWEVGLSNSQHDLMSACNDFSGVLIGFNTGLFVLCASCQSLKLLNHGTMLKPIDLMVHLYTSSLPPACILHAHTYHVPYTLTALTSFAYLTLFNIGRQAALTCLFGY